MIKVKALRVHPCDNVEVALQDILEGETVQVAGDSFPVSNKISAKHKFAVKDLAIGEDILMYGVLVGKATRAIPKGALINTDNILHASGDYRLNKRNLDWHIPDVTAWSQATFMGFHRADGSVGTANYWLVIPLVFCENNNVLSLQEAFVKELGYQTEQSGYRTHVQALKELFLLGKTPAEILNYKSIPGNELPGMQKLFANVDGIKFLTHTLGCGGTKQDSADLCGLLAGYITHPNVAGATVLSLGCQNAQISLLTKAIEQRDKAFSKPLYILEQQQIGNESSLLHEAVKKTFVGLIKANEFVRKPAPLSKLCVGLECGGSDGFSGISANLAVGYVSDVLVALGASVILSEFPELCGVEQQLSDRCTDEKLAGKFMQLMTDYQTKATINGAGFDSNPSAGNIKDGLITDAIKSAGAAKKGGTSPITDVLDYPEKVTKKGLNLLCTPGSDIESTTAEVAAGANLVLFTTGLGTPTGNPIAPVIKIATNTSLYQKMNDIIDLDAGTIITGLETPGQVGDRILTYIIQIASGELKAKSSALGHDDFIPWKRDISL